jgi:hypothetical protein
MNGPIGKQMVDTLVESSSNVEVCYQSSQIHNLLNKHSSVSARL